MNRRWAILSGVLLMGIASVGIGSARGTEIKMLRVCADPNNLPFSNQRLEGFENKIAAVVAQELHATLSYYWWPHQRGLVRRTLNEENCDVLIGIPKGYDLVLWTKPYYRTGYVLTYRKDRGLHIDSLDDPRLKTLKIGVHGGTPPEEGLAEREIIGDNVIHYSMFLGWQYDEHLAEPVQDLVDGKTDVAIVWGPVIGYYIKKHAVDFLEVVPLQDRDRHNPMSFEISMGVKKGNKALKGELEQALERKRDEITQILKEYGVPLVTARASG